MLDPLTCRIMGVTLVFNTDGGGVSVNYQLGSICFRLGLGHQAASGLLDRFGGRGAGGMGRGGGRQAKCGAVGGLGATHESGSEGLSGCMERAPFILVGCRLMSRMHLLMHVSACGRVCVCVGQSEGVYMNKHDKYVSPQQSFRK